MNEILAYESSFPKGMGFKDVWCVSEDAFRKLPSKHEEDFEKEKHRLSRLANGTFDLSEANNLVKTGKWDEPRFRAWLEKYWSPLVQIEHDKLVIVRLTTFRRYFSILEQKLDKIRLEATRKSLYDAGLDVPTKEQLSEQLKNREKASNDSRVGVRVDQDDGIEKFRKACEKRGLEKGKTIPPRILFEIAKEAGIPDVPRHVAQFKKGSRAYAIARTYASLKGYKKSPKR